MQAIKFVLFSKYFINMEEIFKNNFV